MLNFLQIWQTMLFNFVLLSFNCFRICFLFNSFIDCSFGFCQFVSLIYFCLSCVIIEFRAFKSFLGCFS